MDWDKLFGIERQIKNPCHLCNEWTPESGCKHYLPDSETILLKAGYKIYKPGINTRQKKFILSKNGEGKSHRFESLAKAADMLVHRASQKN